MVMLPVQSHGYSCWHINIFLWLLFLCSSYQTHAAFELETAFQNSSGSFWSNSNESNTFHLIKQSGSLSCDDLKGVGSFDTACVLGSSFHLEDDLNIFGKGNLELSPYVSILCAIKNCSINLNFTGNVTVGQGASLIAGTITVTAFSITLCDKSAINTTALGGPPPPQTSGTPIGHDGAGGGHGGRGASCRRRNDTNNWGGDSYAWTNLAQPWSYGSKGASTLHDEQFGGDGGGRVNLTVKDVLFVNGSVSAEGGDGGTQGGGGSGGSIIVQALKLKGMGIISAAGGRGWAGGGGGRISLNCYSIQDVKVTVHGGESIGCPGNAGAAGTNFDATLLSLRVSNDNFTTQTETPLLDFSFSTSPLWSNIFVESKAKVLVPLVWTRVQVRGQISLLDDGSISFGLSSFPVSEFELVAEELLLSDSVIKVYGAFRVYVKMLLMWESKIQIDGGGNSEVATSVLEVRNLIVLRQNSVIRSNANLGVYGQGLLRLSGQGDIIQSQRLFLSLFYNIDVGPGSLLQAPLDDANDKNLDIKSHCESQACPMELITPPEDCHVNNSLSFTLQVCRVEDLTISGLVKGSIIHIHRSKTVTIWTGGMISASELGCKEGLGKGTYSRFGVGGGAGHGGRGGPGVFNGRLSEGGPAYGDADLPCELGSGSGGSSEMEGYVAGGGMIVMGSMKWPLSRLDIYGSLRADGQSCSEGYQNDTLRGGLGGGSGGTVLVFLQTLALGVNSSLSLAGGHGGQIGGGGGGGGRVHFDWANMAVGDEYVPIATVNGTIDTSGGTGNGDGHDGEEGTITGRKCPRGLYGTFCIECPVGTYKNEEGSDPSLCMPCSLEHIPSRADFVYVRGGVADSACPYKCVSEKYKKPNCYTPLEDLIYTFGGPWPFAILVIFTLAFLSVLLSALRIKLIGSGYSYQTTNSLERCGPHSFPYLLSLAEVRGTNRAEETQSHVHRMYFMGPNTFREPWHLPYSPPDAIIEIVYEDAFNRFIDEINSVAAYEWWEGSVHSILSVLAYPCAWSWKQWRRRNKIHRLQEYVKSEYDHSCLRSCRSRALYKGMKVGSTPDLMIAYIDFFLGGDEKRMDLTSIPQRFPLCILFGGDGSYMSPFNLHSDTLLSNLIGQHISPSIWNRFVAGLNAQLRTVRQGSVRSALVPVIIWINSHGNPQLLPHGVRIDLGWFQATASGYYQLGILVSAGDMMLHSMHDILDTSSKDLARKHTAISRKNPKQLHQGQSQVSTAISRKRLTGRINGGIINEATLSSLDYKRDFLFPFSLLLHNTRPIGFQDTLQLLITLLLLGDLVITLLTLLQFYWISLAAFLVILLILPLSLLSPFPAGLNALFSQGPRRSSLARVYALWNATSLSNIVVAFFCGFLHYGFSPYGLPERANTWNSRREDDNWWLLSTALLLVKSLQARMVDWHIANLEIQDQSLFSHDPQRFWEEF